MDKTSKRLAIIEAMVSYLEPDDDIQFDLDLYLIDRQASVVDLIVLMRDFTDYIEERDSVQGVN